MRELEALRLALYLFHLPSAVRPARERPLPAGVTALLEVAADEAGAVEDAAERLERPVEVVREASAFFIEQMLMVPDADAYRILGVSRSAGDAELRRNMALLLRWLHPDMKRAGERAVFATSVTKAWEALKSQERRAAYDAANPPRLHAAGAHSRGRQRRSSQPAALGEPEPRRAGLLGTALRLLLGSRATR